MTLSNTEIVKGIYDAWPKGLDAFLEALAPDVEWRFADNFVYGKVNPIIGHQALREGSLKSLKSDWDDFDGELEELLDAGRRLSGLAIMSESTRPPVDAFVLSSPISGRSEMAR